MFAGDNNISLIERPSPDGGEDIADNVNVDEDENDCWSDWENQTEVNESDVTSKSENGNIQVCTILCYYDQKKIHGIQDLFKILYDRSKEIYWVMHNF